MPKMIHILDEWAWKQLCLRHGYDDPMGWQEIAISVKNLAATTGDPMVDDEIQQVLERAIERGVRFVHFRR